MAENESVPCTGEIASRDPSPFMSIENKWFTVVDKLLIGFVSVKFAGCVASDFASGPVAAPFPP